MNAQLHVVIHFYYICIEIQVYSDLLIASSEYDTGNTVVELTSQIVPVLNWRELANCRSRFSRSVQKREREERERGRERRGKEKEGGRGRAREEVRVKER